MDAVGRDGLLALDGSRCLSAPTNSLTAVNARGLEREDIARSGEIWSILPASTVDGYLLCIGIKKGYWST